MRCNLYDGELLKVVLFYTIKPSFRKYSEGGKSAVLGNREGEVIFVDMFT